MILFASVVFPIALAYPKARPLLVVVLFAMVARVAVNAHFVGDAKYPENLEENGDDDRTAADAEKTGKNSGGHPGSQYRYRQSRKLAGSHTQFPAARPKR